VSAQSAPHGATGPHGPSATNLAVAEPRPDRASVLSVLHTAPTQSTISSVSARSPTTRPKCGHGLSRKRPTATLEAVLKTIRSACGVHGARALYLVARAPKRQQEFVIRPRTMVKNARCDRRIWICTREPPSVCKLTVNDSDPTCGARGRHAVSPAAWVSRSGSVGVSAS